MVDVRGESKMRVQDDSEDFRTTVEFERRVTNPDVEGCVRFTRPIRREEGDAGLGRGDGEVFRRRPVDDLVNIPLKAVGEWIKLPVGVREIHIIRIRLGLLGRVRAVRNEKIEQNRTQDGALRNSGADGSSTRDDALIGDGGSSAAKKRRGPMDDVGMERRVDDAVEEDEMVDRIEGLSNVRRN